MKRFHFKLTTLHKVRQLREDQALAAFEIAERQVALCQGKVEALREEQRVAALDLNLARQRSLSALDLADYSNYARQLTHLLEEAEDALLGAKNQAHQKRLLLEKALKERKILDKLKENQYASWQKLELQAERAFADEMAVIRFKEKDV